MVTLAVLTTAHARHEVYTVGPRGKQQYRIITTPPGVEATDLLRHTEQPLSRRVGDRH